MAHNMKNTNMQKLKKKKTYTAPWIQVVEFITEEGFAISFKSANTGASGTDSSYQINSFGTAQDGGGLVF